MEITEEQFPLESEVQQLTEANLQDLFDLTFVKSGVRKLSTSVMPCHIISQLAAMYVKLT